MTAVRGEDPALHRSDTSSQPEDCFGWHGTLHNRAAGMHGHQVISLPPPTRSALKSSSAKHLRPQMLCSTANHPSPPGGNAKLPASRLSDSGGGKGKDASRQEWSSDISPVVPQVPICRRAGRHQAGASPNKYSASGPQRPIGALPATLAEPRGRSREEGHCRCRGY